jgi:hypothetical protein
MKLGVSDLIKKLPQTEAAMNPSMSDYFDGDASEYFSIIKQALKIIREYETGERIYDLARATEDCIRLAALHSHISEMVGYLQGMASRTESQRKMAKSKYAIALKDARDKEEAAGSTVRLTEAEVDHAARSLSDEDYEIARDMEIISRMITTSWYAISDFIRVLESVCKRSTREHSGI